MPVTMQRRALALVVAVMLCLAVPVAHAAAAQAPRMDTYDKAAPEKLLDDDLIGKAALVMDSDTGTLLYDKNGARRTYPASTTKIMTCLLALEHCSMDEMVTIPTEVNQVPLDSSKTGVVPGEQMTMGDLLGGMMIMSGNDAAIAVAMHVSGTVESFVELMNARARALGCRDTHFVNPHGYHDEDHYSTAYDLALITREAMNNRDFCEIVAAKSYTMAPTAIREKKTFATKNAMFVSSSNFYYPDLIGVKTGYHSKAGQCFVGAAVKDGVLLISVVLKSDRDGKWTDTARLMDYAITRYQTLSLNQLFARAPVYASIKNAALDDEGAGLVALTIVPGSALDSYKVRFLPEFESAALQQFTSSLSVQYTTDLIAPIREGDILGDLTMTVDGQPITAKVVASRDVEVEAEPFTLQSMFPSLADALNGNAIIIGVSLLILIIILVIALRVRTTLRNRRRRREMLRRRRAAYDRYRSRMDG